MFALPGSGPAYLLGPTGGYLIGFIVAPYLVGRLIAGRLGANPAGAFVSFLVGALSIHTCGFAWLSVLLGSPLSALRAGFLPFVLFDFAKVVVATGIHTGYVRWKPLKKS